MKIEDENGALVAADHAVFAVWRHRKLAAVLVDNEIWVFQVEERIPCSELDYFSLAAYAGRHNFVETRRELETGDLLAERVLDVLNFSLVGERPNLYLTRLVACCEA